ncbi:MAG: flagellar hook-length control protein FliK [Oscillospiraceae bacterium]|jgi:hypothetical protein|nr:flagellar hook-length control protein FliK [Oscillospiraceae bacterium]
MKILNTTGAQTSAATGRVSTFGLPATLGEGERLEARVLSAGDDSAVLKTGDGRVFHARLDGGASLVPGENVSLVVEDQTDGVITLSIMRSDGGRAAPDTAGLIMSAAADTRGDMALLPEIMARLEALGLPASEATVITALELMRANPALSPDEAIFLAAQGMADTPEALDALRLLLSGDGKLDKMLEQLRSAILEAGESAGARGLIIENGQLKLTGDPDAAREAAQPGGFGAEAPPEGQDAGAKLAANGARGTLAADTAASRGGEGAAAWDGVRGAPETQDVGVRPAPPVAAGEVDGARQSAGTTPEFTTTTAAPDAAAPSVAAPGTTARGVATADTAPGVADAATDAAAPNTAADATPENASRAVAPDAREARPASTAGERAAVADTPPVAPKAEGAAVRPEADSAVARADGAPRNAATDGQAPLAGGRVTADGFIESLFAEIDGERAGELAGRLKAAVSELPGRLTRLAESAAGSGVPGGDAIAERAVDIARQARVMNAAEQYVYAQIPVVVSGERRAAELYVFKRKRSPISTDDANILLSLDLPALGHWEALVNVRGRDVSLQMRASGEDAREHLSGNTARLHEILSDAGYRLTGARVTTGRGEKTTPLTALSHTRARAGAGIDVVV